MEQGCPSPYRSRLSLRDAAGRREGIGHGSGNATELFDPGTGKWGIADALEAGIAGGPTALLSDGRVLLAGVSRVDAGGNTFHTRDAQIYDTLDATWRNAASLNTLRTGHTATLLQDGKVLVAGGVGGFTYSDSAPLDSAEIYEGGGHSTPFGRAIGAGFTGSWYDPAQSGHGFSLAGTGPGSPQQLLAYWFTFAPEGGQSWVAALGPVDGRQVVVHGVQTVGTGARFPPNFDAANAHQESWGTLTFTFSDCNHGHVDWNPTAPGYASGGMDLTRLTLPAGLTCSP